MRLEKSRPPLPPSSAWKNTGATSTTGTTQQACNRLEPKYVSTVDSGNLAGHLIALCKLLLVLDGCSPAMSTTSLDGIEDILDILSEDLAAIPNDRHILRPIRKHFESQVSALRRAIDKAPRDAGIFFGAAYRVCGSVCRYSCHRNQYCRGTRHGSRQATAFLGRRVA